MYNNSILSNVFALYSLRRDRADAASAEEGCSWAGTLQCYKKNEPVPSSRSGARSSKVGGLCTSITISSVCTVVFLL